MTRPTGARASPIASVRNRNGSALALFGPGLFLVSYVFSAVARNSDIPSRRLLALSLSTEGLEDERHHVRGNGISSVGDLDDNFFSIGVRSDDNRRPLRCVFHGVSQEVRQNLRQPIRAPVARDIALGFELASELTDHVPSAGPGRLRECERERRFYRVDRREDDGRIVRTLEVWSRGR
jgi:hypothetical protein